MKCLLYSSIVLLVACRQKQESILVQLETITESVYASGIVKSKNQHQVYSTANGLIKHIYIAEGDTVRAGDPLFEVENQIVQLNTENAKLMAEYSNLAANANKLNELKVNRELAKTKMSNDSLLFERQKALWSARIGSQNEFEQRELAYKNAVAAYQAIVFRYQELARQLEFADKQSKKALQISSTQAKDYVVRSSIHGKVYSLLKEKGEMVNIQSVVAVLGDADEFVLEFQIDEYDITKIKPGQQIWLNMDSYKGQVYEAQVKKINPLMNERSKTFLIEGFFITKPPVLYPNLTAEANVVIQTKEHALTIPRSYLIEEEYVLGENNLKQKVVTGLKDYQKVEILQGLSANSRIYKPMD